MSLGLVLEHHTGLAYNLLSVPHLSSVGCDTVFKAWTEKCIINDPSDGFKMAAELIGNSYIVRAAPALGTEHSQKALVVESVWLFTLYPFLSLVSQCRALGLRGLFGTAACVTLPFTKGTTYGETALCRGETAFYQGETAPRGKLQDCGNRLLLHKYMHHIAPYNDADISFSQSS